MFWFLPREVGPFGIVGASGALIRVVGSTSYVFDLDTELMTAFSYAGTATDICALLSAS